MKVIFLQDVPQLAQAGQVKEVADGYARNYLIPRKLAALAQPSAVSQLEIRARKMEAHLTTELQELAGQLEGKEVSLKAKAGAKEKLYGSITSADIAAELKNATGLEIDTRKKTEAEAPAAEVKAAEAEKPAKKEKKAPAKAKKTAEKKVTKKKEAAPKTEKKTTRKTTKAKKEEKTE
jgi:large subunit ribosomal protein L9